MTTPVYCYGDSLTAGTGAVAGMDFPTQLQALLGEGFTVENRGIGGQSSNQISARQGGNVISVRLSGNRMEHGANPITHVNGRPVGPMATGKNRDQPLSSAASNKTRHAHVNLAGVTGTITRCANGGPPSRSESYTFIPDRGETMPIACPPEIPMVFLNRDTPAGIQIFFVGRNNFGNPAQIETDVGLMVSRLDPAHRRFIVMDVISGYSETEWRGSPGHTKLTALSQKLESAYRENFLGIRRVLIDDGLDMVNIASTVFDRIDMAHDVTPTSLRSRTHEGTLAHGVASSAIRLDLVPGKNRVSVGNVLHIGTERIRVLSLADGKVACVRGYDGTVATCHEAGDHYFVADKGHLNSAGYTVIARSIHAFMQRKGWAEAPGS